MLYIAEQQTNLMLRFDLATEKYTWLQIGNPGQIWLASAWDGTYFYFVPLTQGRLLRWDGQDEYVEYDLPGDCRYDRYGPVNVNIIDGTLVLQGYNCDAVLYDLEDMSCRTEQVRYNYAYKIREDFYTGYDMATDRFVIQDGAKRLEYTCVFDERDLQKYLQQARSAGKIGLQGKQSKKMTRLESDILQIVSAINLNGSKARRGRKQSYFFHTRQVCGQSGKHLAGSKGDSGVNVMSYRFRIMIRMRMEDLQLIIMKGHSSRLMYRLRIIEILIWRVEMRISSISITRMMMEIV